MHSNRELDLPEGVTAAILEPCVSGEKGSKSKGLKVCKTRVGRLIDALIKFPQKLKS